MSPLSYAKWHRRARQVLDGKTKPPGSLGRLEAVAARLAALHQTLRPCANRCRVLIFAGDHGVADESVSAYPKAVTAEMIRNFAQGGAAVTVLARAVGAEVEVVDVGVDADLSTLEGLQAVRITHAKVRRSTRATCLSPVGRSRTQIAASASLSRVMPKRRASRTR